MRIFNREWEDLDETQKAMVLVWCAMMFFSVLAVINVITESMVTQMHFKRIEEIKKIETIKGNVSAYSSTPEETDDTPFTTASGSTTRHGVVANNCLEFGTEVEIDGQRYTVEDRMNKRYGCSHFDIWVESQERAIEFGRQELSIRYER